MVVSIIAPVISLLLCDILLQCMRVTLGFKLFTQKSDYTCFYNQKSDYTYQKSDHTS